MDTYHVYQDTPEGRLPFTYMVFGPYSNGDFDVEVHRTHVQDNEDTRNYLFTHTVKRDTHIVADMWEAMEDYFSGYYLKI